MSYFKATSKWQELSGLIGDKDKNLIKDEYVDCHWHIQVYRCIFTKKKLFLKASENRTIELRILKVGRVCSSGCFFGNVEFKTSLDFRRTGRRWFNLNII